MDNHKISYTEEQLKAAFALNLCTVSISQIIDYNDMNVMEQEYEGILNNINIEQMPKDEALLNILKQILDTINFFRIEEGEKRFIEKEYQQKMKNAIWSAVSNVHAIVGTDPASMVLSLAAMVGTGYMNYRRAKSEAKDQKERQEWELQKTALEQFNGLRRELFDTAWRLSAKHNFPDELRLTERQIKQYNNILMDSDIIRRYERFEAIKDNFIAYPPFWYNFGNTANEISKSNLKLSDTTRLEYRENAKAHFEHFRKVNQQGLLREDPISASCALELAELLDFNTQRDEIKKLMYEAIKFSGRANDVMQLVAMTYLKLDDFEDATNVLAQLVNEQYNTTLNAQILSGLYVKGYIESKDLKLKSKYEILCNQVGTRYLYPMPQNENESLTALEEKFIADQQEILLQKYEVTVNNLEKKYEKRFDRIVPFVNAKNQPVDEVSRESKKFYTRKVLGGRGKRKEEFMDMLREREIDYDIIELLNDLFKDFNEVPFLSLGVKNNISYKIENLIKDNKNKLQSLLNKIESDTLGLFDMDELIDMKLSDFIGDTFNDIYTEISLEISCENQMDKLTEAEQYLSSFCESHSLEAPENISLCDNERCLPSIKTEKIRFDITLLRDTKDEVDEVSNRESMIENIESYKNNIIINSLNVKLLIYNGTEFKKYFNESKINEEIKSQTIAVLKNESNGYELLFTMDSIYPVKNGSLKTPAKYGEISLAKDKIGYVDISGIYNFGGANTNEFLELVKNLDKLSVNQEQEKKNPMENFANKIGFKKNK